MSITPAKLTTPEQSLNISRSTYISPNAKSPTPNSPKNNPEFKISLQALCPPIPSAPLIYKAVKNTSISPAGAGATEKTRRNKTKAKGKQSQMHFHSPPYTAAAAPAITNSALPPPPSSPSRPDR